MTGKHIGIINKIRKSVAGSDFAKDNAGFSLVELIVAVAILAVVFTPIVNSFLTTSRTNSRAQSIQNATSLAETVMEDVKSKSIEQLKAEAAADANMTLTEEYASASPEEDERPIRYTVAYKDKTATNGRKYDVNVTVDSQSYSYEKGVAKADGTLPDEDDVSNANLVEVPIFKDIDSSKNAVVSWEINRNDGVAIEVLLDKYVAFTNKAPWNDNMHDMWWSGVNLIRETFMKETVLNVDYVGDKVNVTCDVTYKQDPNKPKTNHDGTPLTYDPVSYTVYESQFKLDDENKCPDIYVFYTLMMDDEEVIKRSEESGGSIALATENEVFKVNVNSAPPSKYNSRVFFIVQKRQGKTDSYTLEQTGSDLNVKYEMWGGYYMYSHIQGVSTDGEGFATNGHRFLTNLDYSYVSGTDTVDLKGDLFETQVNDNVYEITVDVLDGSDKQATLTSTMLVK